MAVSTVLDHDYDLNGVPTALAANLGGVIVGSNISGDIRDLANQYVWDALGRLTSVTQASQSSGNSVAAKLATFQYDAAGELTDLRSKEPILARGWRCPRPPGGQLRGGERASTPRGPWRKRQQRNDLGIVERTSEDVSRSVNGCGA